METYFKESLNLKINMLCLIFCITLKRETPSKDKQGLIYKKINAN